MLNPAKTGRVESCALTARAAGPLGAPGSDRGQGQASEVRATAVLGAAAALLGIEPAVRVHVGLEAGQERGTAGRGGMP